MTKDAKQCLARRWGSNCIMLYDGYVMIPKHLSTDLRAVLHKFDSRERIYVGLSCCLPARSQFIFFLYPRAGVRTFDLAAS